MIPLNITDTRGLELPFELTQDVEADSLLRIKVSGMTMLMVLRADDVRSEEGQSFKVVHQYSRRDIQKRWGWYGQTLSMAIVQAPTTLPRETKIRVNLSRSGSGDLNAASDGSAISPSFFLSGIDWVLTLGRVESVEAETFEPVAEPLVLRLVAGEADHLEAYLKHDGRLLIEHFDKCHNPTDSPEGPLALRIGNQARQVEPVSGVKATVVRMEKPPDRAQRIRVLDPAGREAASNAFPAGLDGTPIFFGEFHWHCRFSGDGERDLADALTSARDELGLDFAGPADHIGTDGKYTYGTAEQHIDICKQFDDPGSFCTIPGAELGGRYGHINFYTDNHERFLEMTRKMKAAFDKYGWPDDDYPWQALRSIHVPGHSLLIPHHTNMDSFVTEGVVRPDDGLPYWCPMPWPVPAESELLRLVEIVQSRGSFEQETVDAEWKVSVGGFGASVRSALMKGYRLGFIAGTDNHCGWPTRSSMGPVCGLTGIQARSLDTAGLFDALQNRRTYATSGARIVADATLNGRPMGSELELAPGEPRRMHIRIGGTAPIVAVQIISAGMVLAELPVVEKSLDYEGEWEDDRPGRPLKDIYYYVRARQSDGHCVWLSPFWIDLLRK